MERKIKLYQVIVCFLDDFVLTVLLQWKLRLEFNKNLKLHRSAVTTFMAGLVKSLLNNGDILINFNVKERTVDALIGFKSRNVVFNLKDYKIILAAI